MYGFMVWFANCFIAFTSVVGKWAFENGVNSDVLSIRTTGFGQADVEVGSAGLAEIPLIENWHSLPMIMISKPRAMITPGPTLGQE